MSSLDYLSKRLFWFGIRRDLGASTSSLPNIFIGSLIARLVLTHAIIVRVYSGQINYLTSSHMNPCIFCMLQACEIIRGEFCFDLIGFDSSN